MIEQLLLIIIIAILWGYRNISPEFRPQIKRECGSQLNAYSYYICGKDSCKDCNGNDLEKDEIQLTFKSIKRLK